MANDGYFGLCPKCKKDDGCLNIGKGHWYFCKQHRLRWFVGSNLFSSWRYETEAEQRRRYEELGFDTYKDVKPFYPKMEGDQRGNTPDHPRGRALGKKQSSRSKPLKGRNRAKKK